MPTNYWLEYGDEAAKQWDALANDPTQLDGFRNYARRAAARVREATRQARLGNLDAAGPEAALLPGEDLR